MFDSEDGREQLRAFKQVAVLVVVAGLGMWLLINWLSSGPTEQKQSSVPQVSSPAPTPEVSTQASAPEDAEKRAAANLAKPSYPMGREFSVGYFSYIVHRAEVTSNPSDPSHAPVLAVFVNVRNDDDSDSTTPEFRLLDETGHDTAGAILETNSYNLITEMKPGVVNRGYLLFDKFPANGKYILLVSGGLISGQSAIVPLFAGEPVPDAVTRPQPQNQEPNQATVQGKDITELRTAKCVESLEKHYTAQLAVATCRCVMAVYEKTGSAERAQNAFGQCNALAMQALTNPGQTATLPWDAIR